MESGESTRPLNLLPLEELATLFLRLRNDNVREAFAKLCLKLLEGRVRHVVMCGHIFPDFLGPNTFVQDAYDRAATKFTKGIDQLESPQAVVSWLKRIALTAVLEELDKWHGRGNQRIRHESYDALAEDAGEQKEGFLYESQYLQAPEDVFKKVQERERAKLLNMLLTIHAQSSPRGAESSVVIRLRRDEELTITEIARMQARSISTMHKILRDDYAALRSIALRLKINFRDLS